MYHTCTVFIVRQESEKGKFLITIFLVKQRAGPLRLRQIFLTGFSSCGFCSGAKMGVVSRQRYRQYLPMLDDSLNHSLNTAYFDITFH